MSTHGKSAAGNGENQGILGVVLTWLAFGILGELFPIVIFGATLYNALGDFDKAFGIIANYQIVPAMTFGIFGIAIGDAWLEYKYGDYKPTTGMFLLGLVLFAVLCVSMGISNWEDAMRQPNSPVQRPRNLFATQCVMAFLVLAYCAFLKAVLVTGKGTASRNREDSSSDNGGTETTGSVK